MLFQRINRSDPEKIFLVVKNSWSTDSLTNGQAVQWDFTADYDGVGVTRPTARATNAGTAFAGIVTETIAAGAYGLIQIYGYHSATRIRAKTSTAPAIHMGSPLALASAGGVYCLESIATGSKVIFVYPCAIAFSHNLLWTTTARGVFIKAM
jgi:hypothetical protein